MCVDLSLILLILGLSNIRLSYLSGCNSVLQRHSICKSDFILLTGRDSCSVLSLGWLLNPAGIREGSKKLVRETGLVSVLLQVLGLCLYSACSSLCRVFCLCTCGGWCLLPATAVIWGERSGSSVWTPIFMEQCLWQECWAYFSHVMFFLSSQQCFI